MDEKIVVKPGLRFKSNALDRWRVLCHSYNMSSVTWVCERIHKNKRPATAAMSSSFIFWWWSEAEILDAIRRNGS